jgi:hypothetical protein
MTFLGLGNGRLLFRIGIVFWIGFGLLMLGFVLGFGADYLVRERFSDAICQMEISL